MSGGSVRAAVRVAKESTGSVGSVKATDGVVVEGVTAGGGVAEAGGVAIKTLSTHSYIKRSSLTTL